MSQSLFEGFFPPDRRSRIWGHVSESPRHQIVVNWHVTEACNFLCRYCYAKWDAGVDEREIIRDEARSLELLHRLYDFFCAENDANPLRRQMSWNSVRLNIAGGEPLLYERRIVAIAEIAKRIGFDVSLISNGSFLTPEVMEGLAPRISLLGLSLDASSDPVNIDIGRVDRRGKGVDLEALASTVDLGRRLNPSMSLKINTVVNSLNHHLDLTQLIRRFAPDKWKVLRMLPVVSHQLEVSQSEFDGFVDRHSHCSDILCVEDHADMTESYIMVDPVGRFFQNSATSGAAGYFYSEPILKVGAARAFGRMSFTTRKFQARYVRFQ